MSVYVDPLFKTAKTRTWPYAEACHMWAALEPEVCLVGADRPG